MFSRSRILALRWAFIALGANVGNPRQQIEEAIKHLQTFSDHPLRRSSLWHSTPVDCPPGSPPFVNGVVGLVPRPDETPETLLAKLHALERTLGREPSNTRNAPRRLDLDLIAFADETRATNALTLPHSRATRRRFVLAPLNEIAPELVLPGQSKSVRELLGECRTPEVVEREAHEESGGADAR